jgi:hypothetical protein
MFSPFFSLFLRPARSLYCSRDNTLKLEPKFMSKSKSIDRRAVLKTLGASAAAQVLAGQTSGSVLAGDGHHPRVPLEDGQVWQPQFFTVAENETVTVLSELIIPETDTPGARAANVNQYIDFILASDKKNEGFDPWTWMNKKPIQRDGFRRGLKLLDRLSSERFGQRFVETDEASQVELLTDLAAPDAASAIPQAAIDFFAEFRGLTIEGYYGSEIGMFEELDFQGNTVMSEFEGCNHAEHLNWDPQVSRNRNEEQ